MGENIGLAFNYHFSTVQVESKHYGLDLLFHFFFFPFCAHDCAVSN